MKRNKVEFKVGDKVTFNPYGKRLKAKIMAVDIDGGKFTKDERIFYAISGDECVSECTGLCIVESQYFKA